MKPIYSYALLAAFAAVGQALAVDATTTPVGYVTSYIQPNVSGTPDGSSTFISSSLLKASVFAGASTASPSGGNVINFSGNVPAGLGAGYILEITSATGEGWWSELASSTTTSVTVADTFPGSLPTNVSVTIRPVATIQDVFGENDPGLAAFPSPVLDEIQLLDPVTQAATSVVRVGTDWINAVSEEVADSLPIYPGTAVKVIHHANTTLSVVVSGEVKTSKTQVDIYPGDNWLGQPRSAGGTFAAMGLGTQIAGSDAINLIRADAGFGQPTDSFVTVSGSVYNAVTEELADTEIVAEGAGYLVNRPTGAQYTITIPATVVAP